MRIARKAAEDRCPTSSTGAVFAATWGKPSAPQTEKRCEGAVYWTDARRLAPDQLDADADS